MRASRIKSELPSLNDESAYAVAPFVMPRADFCRVMRAFNMSPLRHTRGAAMQVLLQVSASSSEQALRVARPQPRLSPDAPHSPDRP
jgi:hypothetical protein